ncbi:hypothetical protein Tco_0609707, partial [Tanacetum coccineum]
MPNTRSGASRTRKGTNEQINRRLAGALGAADTARYLELVLLCTRMVPNEEDKVERLVG